MRNMSEEKKDNPGLPKRVGALEVDVSAMKTDIKWIKLMVAPTFLVSMASLIILIIINLG